MVMEEVELLRAACCIAGADGEISEKERKSLKDLADRAGVGAPSLRAMMDLAVSDEKFRADQLEMVHADPERAFETLYRVSQRDPQTADEEHDMLLHFGGKLGLSREEMDRIIQRVGR